MSMLAADTQGVLIDLQPDANMRGKPRLAQALTVARLAQWSRRQLRVISHKYGQAPSSDVFVFAQAIKLGEEVGELHAEVLGRASFQRAGKADRYSPAGLAGELADVVICAAILAEAVGIDLATALECKMLEVDTRATSA